MKMKMLKKYDISQCALYKCQSKKRLADILKMEKIDLKIVNQLIEYHSFEIDKKKTSPGQPNEKRCITAPAQPLKNAQQRILQLLQPLQRPEWLISGEKGKCYLDNGKIHLSSRYFLTVDIRKFYDNCKREYVYRFFQCALHTAPDIAEILTAIVTYNGTIPTGCPTSQIIAFYAYQNMFQEISDISGKYGCVFTLYVDDMTFSSKQSFDHYTLKKEIDIILRKYGHKPKYKKVKYYSKHEHKLVTGTIITPDNKLDIPNCLQKKIYENFIELKKFEGQTLYSANEQKYVLSLRGQLQSAQNINKSRFPEIKRIISSIKMAE